MTLTEFRRTILESKDPTWFNNVEVVFNLQDSGVGTSVKGLSAIYELVLKQADGWARLGEELPRELVVSKSYFENLKSGLTSFLDNNKNADELQLARAWGRLSTQINNVSNRPLRFNSSETEFLLRVHESSPSSVASAFRVITKSGAPNLGNTDQLIGTLMAYEFLVKDRSDIVRRGKLERSKLAEAKRDFDSYIGEAEHELLNHIGELNKSHAQHLNELEILRNEKDFVFNTWFEYSSKKFELFETQSNEKIGALETAYEELLRLSKPANYWKERAIELNQEGKKFMCWLIGLIVFTAGLLFSILWLTPESMLVTFFGNDKSAAVRWTIVFITMISFLAFGIRALTKATFSAFHLSRDAEERERLVYVYLAMIKDSAVDKEERHLIMQSLFSRADTGLLKDDSSPTMPGASHIFERMSK